MPKLYEIVEELRALTDYLDGLVDDEKPSEEVIRDTLESIELALSAKAEGLLKVIRNYEAESEMYASERRRLQALEQAAARKAEKLKEYLTEMLTMAGYTYKNKKKLDTAIGKIAFQKNPPTIEITDYEKVREYFPEAFKGLVEENFTKKPIMEKVKEHLKEQDEADFTEQRGFRWINNKFHMRVR